MTNLNQTPRSARLQIAIFGRRNAGKSSLLNALTDQTAALVSDLPGTTTDPVVKSMELLPLGPVAVTDTAGLDDSGDLGELRKQRTYQVLDRSDLAVFVLDGTVGVREFELHLLGAIRARKIPVVGVINKRDSAAYAPARRSQWEQDLQLELTEVSSLTGAGIPELKAALIRTAPQADREPLLTGDLLQPGDIAVLVIPIDKAAPKGRLILPQQQVIRDILEHDAMAVVTKEQELRATLACLQKTPSLVITDSQAFLKVAADVPAKIPLTSFSILMARNKGDLGPLIRGVRGVERLKPGDSVLIAEGCTHHRQSDDIGTVKIPRWLRQTVGGAIHFEWASGASLPEDLRRYQLIVHCGACMLTGRDMQNRLALAESQGVPIVNYGVFIAYVQGILARAIEPFPEGKLFL